VAPLYIYLYFSKEKYFVRYINYLSIDLPSNTQLLCGIPLLFYLFAQLKCTRGREGTADPFEVINHASLMVAGHKKYAKALRKYLANIKWCCLFSGAQIATDAGWCANRPVCVRFLHFSRCR